MDNTFKIMGSVIGIIIFILALILILVDPLEGLNDETWDAYYTQIDNLEYKGYSKYDLNLNGSMNLIPRLVEDGSIEIEDGSSHKFGFGEEEKFISSVKVKENKNTFTFNLTTDKKRTKVDGLNYFLLSFKKKNAIVNNVFRVNDGYIISSFFKSKKQVMLEKYDNNMNYLWSYTLSKVKTEDFMIKDFLEYNDKYYILTEYLDSSSYNTKIIVIDNEGKVISTKKSDYSFERFLNVGDNKVYLPYDYVCYYDFVKNKVVEDNDIELSDKYFYDFVGVDSNSYYYMSMLDTDNDDDNDDNNYLYKVDFEGNVIGNINLQNYAKIAKIDNKKLTYTFSPTEFIVSGDRIIAHYDAFENEENIFSGTLFFDKNLKFIKNISMLDFLPKDENKEHIHINSIDHSEYSNNKLFISYELESGGPLYVIYDHNGKMIYKKEIENLYSSDGAIFPVCFNDNSIVNYEQFLNEDINYLKIVNFNYKNKK